MPDILYIPAVAIIVVTVWDAFITIFSNRGAGPATGLWMRGVWRMLLYVHGRVPIHKILALAGPLMLVSGILFWYLGLAAGACLAFAARIGSVIHSDSGAAASPVYAGITTGINDYALNHLAYTVLQYFHSPRRDLSPHAGDPSGRGRRAVSPACFSTLSTAISSWATRAR